MLIHSETAWNTASKFGHVLASETRDLAALIDALLAAERERCAKLAEVCSVTVADAVFEYGSAQIKQAREDIAAAIRALNP